MNRWFLVVLSAGSYWLQGGRFNHVTFRWTHVRSWKEKEKKPKDPILISWAQLNRAPRSTLDILWLLCLSRTRTLRDERRSLRTSTRGSKSDFLFYWRRTERKKKLWSRTLWLRWCPKTSLPTGLKGQYRIGMLLVRGCSLISIYVTKLWNQICQC